MAKIKWNKAKLVKAWEGHIENNTCCSDCKNPEVKCPIHKFFMDMKQEVTK